MNAPERELVQHKGMGQASFTQFAVVREIGRRVLAEELQEGALFDSPKAAADFLRLHLGHERVEVSLVLLLNRQNRLINCVELSRGTVAENTVYVREVVKLALDHYADSLIVAHNHPGGAAEPSPSDIKWTGRLKQALELVDVRLLDHFIVTARQAVSLAEQGLL